MVYDLSPLDTRLNDTSMQMDSSPQTRRTSRSSGSQQGVRPSRIEKPKSNNNSPRVTERRKTTSGTKRFATLDDHFRMMFGGSEEEEEEQQQPPRPFSWHPSSTQSNVPSRSSAYEPESQPWMYSASARNSTHGSDFYSLSARSSMYPEQLQNLHPYSRPSENLVTRGSESSDSSWQDVSQQTPANPQALSSLSTPGAEPMPWYLQEWARKNQAQPANGSADFLPIQHPTDEQSKDVVMEEDDVEDDGKELVGMGLYDLPDNGLSWGSSALLTEGTGKGLKLEETWQPPADEDSDNDSDDDAEADDASSDEGSVEELPDTRTEEPRTLPLDTAKSQLPPNMQGQSFFFDGYEDDETVSKEWWFQQLKQPTVRDTGIGFGWL